MKIFLRILYAFLGVLMMASGITCMFNPIATDLMIGYFVGFSMIFDGVALIVKWSQSKKEGNSDPWLLTGAILGIVLGFFFLNSVILQLSIDVIAVYYVAFWFIARGIIAIVRSFKAHHFHKKFDTVLIGAGWVSHLIFGILTVAFGIVCLFKPLFTASLLGVMIGLGVMFVGASLITFATLPNNGKTVDVVDVKEINDDKK